MTLLVVSIALEVAVAVLAALAAYRGRPYLYGLALTFGIYVTISAACSAGMSSRASFQSSS